MMAGNKQGRWATAKKAVNAATPPDQAGQPPKRTEGPFTIEELLVMKPHTQTRDRDGGHRILSAQINARTARIIQEQVYSPFTPYDTPSDLVRDALFIGIHVIWLRYFEGENVDRWQRWLEIERNNIELEFDNRIREEANEFAQGIIKRADSSLEGAARSVERQLLALMAGDDDDYTRRVYVNAMNQLGVHIRLRDYLSNGAIKIIEQPREIV